LRNNATTDSRLFKFNILQREYYSVTDELKCHHCAQIPRNAQYDRLYEPAGILANITLLFYLLGILALKMKS